jgi:hypothetical protein
MDLKYFVFTWPDGSTKEGPGKNAKEAFKALGFNPTTMNALESVEEEPYIFS